MKALCVGDVVGQPGRRFLKPALRTLRNRHDPDLIIVNGENAAGGNGLTPQTADEIFRAGADVITSGNHIWDRREILGYLDSNPRVLRPANYPHPAPGGGVCSLEARDGTTVAVVNLIGRLFMGAHDDPFRGADAILRRLAGQVQATIVDFHAEATSEKMAFAWHLDGRVSAVFGTHTHVPTADERVLTGGTAYISDLGMTGPYESVIGLDREGAVERFLTQRPARFHPATGDVRLSGALIDIRPSDGLADSIERVELCQGDERD